MLVGPGVEDVLNEPPELRGGRRTTVVLQIERSPAGMDLDLAGSRGRRGACELDQIRVGIGETVLAQFQDRVPGVDPDATAVSHALPVGHPSSVIR
jgi:hypothetical protein